jgi:hypothetical protein
MDHAITDMLTWQILDVPTVLAFVGPATFQHGLTLLLLPTGVM